VPDGVRGGRRFTAIQVGPAASVAVQWAGATATRATVPVVVLDADTESGGRLQVETAWPVPHTNEFDGGAFALNVSLGVPVTASTAVLVSSNDTAEILPNAVTLTFTSANWYVPQSVMLSGLGDHRIDGDKPVRITVDAVVDGQAATETVDSACTARAKPAAVLTRVQR
jgi:hypothetical protein